MCGRDVITSTEMLEVCLFRVGTVLRLERDEWSTGERLMQEVTIESAPDPPCFGNYDGSGGCI